MHDVQYLRRREAAAYLLAKYGFGAEKTLGKGVVKATLQFTERPAALFSTRVMTSMLGNFQNKCAAKVILG